jgi:hypothetical protein
MDQYFERPPRVYPFSSASVESLETTSQWTLHVLSSKQDHTSDYRAELAHIKSRLEEHPNSLLAAEQQTKSHIEQWYPGNDFDEAFVAIVTPNGQEENRDLVPPDSEIEYKQSDIRLTVCQKEKLSDSSSTKMPSSITELIDLHPFEYGLHRKNDFPYADTAYPMGLTHQPMSYIYDPSQSDHSRFSRAASTPVSPTSSVPEEPKYYKALVQVELASTLADAAVVDGVRETIGLHGEPHGLLELRALTTQDGGAEIEFFSSKCTT